MMVVGIDPGTKRSAWCMYECRKDGTKFVDYDQWENGVFIKWLPRIRCPIAIEMMSKIHSPKGIGDETFKTCIWMGRFHQSASCTTVSYIYRSTIMSRICAKSLLTGMRKKVDGKRMSNDRILRECLIDLFGGEDAAIGTSKSPGPLFSMSGDMWSALGIAMTFHDTYTEE